MYLSLGMECKLSYRLNLSGEVWELIRIRTFSDTLPAGGKHHQLACIVDLDHAVKFENKTCHFGGY